MSEEERLAFWTKALNLPEFRVVHEHRDTPGDPVRFTVVPSQEVGVCPDCGHASDSVHRRHDSSPIKDLPLGEQPVDLRGPGARLGGGPPRLGDQPTPTSSAGRSPGGRG
jgi:transposase